MVDKIVWLTAIAVAGVTLVNLAHGAWLAVRVALEAQGQGRRLGLRLWLPAFASPSEAAAWLATWRRVLAARDPRLLGLWREGRAVIARHAYLAAGAHLCAMAIVAIARGLA